MTVHFQNGVFPGTHGVPVVESPPLSASRVIYSGVAGQTEIRIARGGRHISIDYLFHNDYPDLVTFGLELDKLHKAVGVHGTLFTTQSFPTDPERSRTYRFCTFDGFEYAALNGQQRPAPLKDFGGNIGGWYQLGILHFWQLKF